MTPIAQGLVSRRVPELWVCRSSSGDDVVHVGGWGETSLCSALAVLAGWAALTIATAGIVIQEPASIACPFGGIASLMGGTTGAFTLPRVGTAVPLLHHGGTPWRRTRPQGGAWHAPDTVAYLPLPAHRL